jgi:hypothetical protein
MATVLSKTFDTTLGAVIVNVKDNLGNTGVHTIYVSGPSGVTDVNAAIAQLLTSTDAATNAIIASFQAAGWTGGS